MPSTLIAELREDGHRDAADAAGGAGDQHLAALALDAVRPRASITASIAVKPAVPIAIARCGVRPAGIGTSHSAFTRAFWA